MEYGIVTRSEEAFKSACQEHDLVADDTYVIANHADLSVMLQECDQEQVTVYLAYDSGDTGVTEREVFDACYTHNRVFS